MHAGIEWTEQVINTFLRIVREHPELTYKEVAQMLSNIFDMPFTKNSVIGKARRLKLEEEETKKDEPVLITDLEWGMCKWPLEKDDDKPPYFYCGRDTNDLGCSWCEEHRARVWTKSRF